MTPISYLAIAMIHLSKGDHSEMHRCLTAALNEQRNPSQPIGHTRKHVTWDAGGGATVTLFSDGEVSIHTPCGEVCIPDKHWGEFCAALSAVELTKLKPEFNRS